jgi:hypothetical protein
MRKKCISGRSARDHQSAWCLLPEEFDHLETSAMQPLLHLQLNDTLMEPCVLLWERFGQHDYRPQRSLAMRGSCLQLHVMKQH